MKITISEEEFDEVSWVMAFAADEGYYFDDEYKVLRDILKKMREVYKCYSDEILENNGPD